MGHDPDPVPDTARIQGEIRIRIGSGHFNCRIQYDFYVSNIILTLLRTLHNIPNVDFFEKEMGKFS